MERVKPNECKHCREYGELGLFCEKHRKKIYALDADTECLLCSKGEKQELGLVRHSRKSKYNSINKCFLVCGAPHAYCYVNIALYKKKGGRHSYELDTIYKHSDGERKTRAEMLADLKRFYDATIRKIHPDINPYTERLYFDNESKEVNAAYQQGVKILNYHPF